MQKVIKTFVKKTQKSGDKIYIYIKEKIAVKKKMIKLLYEMKTLLMAE